MNKPMDEIDSKALDIARGEPGTNHENIIRVYIAALSGAGAEKVEPGRWSVSVTESDGRTYLCLTRDDGVSAALSCRTASANSDTIVSQVVKEFAADYAALIPAQQAVVVDEPAAYWKGAYERMAARNMELEARIPHPVGEVWKPIETAPKDGTWFLAKKGKEIFQTQGSYGNIWIPNGKGGHIPDPGRKTFSWLASEFHSLTPWNPTHWMLVPAPQPVGEVRRCCITGNPVGTDTVRRGYTCPCSVCSPAAPSSQAQEDGR